VKYRLVFKDSYTPEPGKTEEFENTASVKIKLDDDDLTYNAEAQVEYGRPIVDKKMTAAGGSIVDVRIVINPDGKTLAEDAGGFTVVDAMGPSLSFVSLSEIYVTIGDSGKIAYDNPIYKPTDNSITMEFPDSTKIVIEYEARVTGMPGTNVNITNTVSISGYGDYSDEESWGFDVEEVKLQAGYTEAHFYLLKTDKATDARLPGAVFALYNYGYYADFSEAALPAGLTAADKIVDSNGKASETGEYYYLTYGITNETGLITFDNRYINPGDTFLLVEVKAPAGYMKLNDPILIWIHKDNTAQPEGTKVVYHTSEFKVTNETGVLFPESGGAGSGAYMIGGAALMVLAAGVLLIRRNRLPRSRIPG
jgi:LPXTG-motif cell wall-anchored protein